MEGMDEELEMKSGTMQNENKKIPLKENTSLTQSLLSDILMPSQLTMTKK